MPTARQRKEGRDQENKTTQLSLELTNITNEDSLYREAIPTAPEIFWLGIQCIEIMSMQLQSRAASTESDEGTLGSFFKRVS